MNTDDLITALAADTSRLRRVWPDLLAASLGAVALAGAAYLWIAGVRPDLPAALLAQPTIWKWLLPAVIAGAGLPLARRLSSPEGRPGRLPVLFLVAAGVAVWLWGARLAGLPQAEWAGALQGQTLLICLASILGIGLPGLLAALVLLRRGATTRPALTGLSAGLACGGIATLIYALHCTEDDPLFFVTWYGGAICLLGLAGAALGARVLRW